MTGSGTRDDEDVVDGRRLRRARGRRAVVDAMIDLVLELSSLPSVDAIAERAGVSQASVFRYFTTLDELRREAIERYLERFDDLLAVADIGVGPLAPRIDRFVVARDVFYTRTAPMARITRRQAGDVDDFAVTIEAMRATFADQVALHFAPELEPLDPRERVRRVAVVAALTSFEAWDQLDALGDDGRREALRRALADLLDPTVTDRA